MEDIFDDNDIEFDALVKEKRHKEMVDILKKILSTMTDLNKDHYSVILKKLLESSESLPGSIKSILEVILKKMDSIKQVNKVVTNWTFKVKRDEEGYIDTIIAEGK
jgi:hypothetical protein